MKKEKYPFHKNRILLSTLLPVLAVGLIISSLSIFYLTSPLFFFIRHRTDAELMFASNIGLNICEDYFDYLLDLRLEDNPQMNSTLKKEAIRDIKKISKKLYKINMIIIEDKKSLVGSSVHLKRQNGNFPKLEKRTSDIITQGLWGSPVRMQYRYFPFWKWHIISFIYEKDYLRPITLAKRIVYTGTVGVLITVLFTLFLTFSLYVNRPLKRIIRATKDIAQGRFGKVDIARTGEIGQLAHSFNAMIDSLKKKDTKVKNLLEALKLSEERYRTLVEETLDGIFIQKGSRIIFANRPLYEMLGYKEGELLSMDHWLVYHPQYQELTREQARARLRGEKVISQYEVKMQRKDGSWFYAELSAKVIGVGGGLGIRVWIRNITERKHAEEIQRATEKKYRSIFENALEGIFQSTLDGRFITVNPALARIYGYDSPEEVIDMIQDLAAQLYVKPSVREEFLREIMEKGFVRGFETEAYRKDGSIAVTSVDAYVVRDQMGNVTYIEGFIEDITELKQKEEERKKLEAQFRQAQKMEAVGTLAGGIAHDFNNLLQAISGYTDLLLMSKDGDDQDYEKLMHIQTTAQRAGELTQRLLTFSRKVESKLRPVGLNQEVKQVERLLRRTIPRMIDIELYLQEDLKVINADPAQMEQAMMNIGVNARDAMPEGGRLVFETQDMFLDEEYCKTHLGAVPGEYVVLSISDTGCGMDRETLEHIFEPFYTTKETGKGTGLGLAMVYGIVKSHGGYIMCYSEPGEGTTFKIYFPVMQSEVGEPEKERKEEEIQGGKETILLVDDEKDILDIGKEMLEGFGYRVITAQSGEDAVEIVREMERCPDLVILDLNMPGMGGNRCLEILLEMNPGIKVIIASGYAANGKAKERVDSGAAGFIGKPYRLADMLRKIREGLDA